MVGRKLRALIFGHTRIVIRLGKVDVVAETGVDQTSYSHYPAEALTARNHPVFVRPAAVVEVDAHSADRRALAQRLHSIGVVPFEIVGEYSHAEYSRALRHPYRVVRVVSAVVNENAHAVSRRALLASIVVGIHSALGIPDDVEWVVNPVVRVVAAEVQANRDAVRARRRAARVAIVSIVAAEVNQYCVAVSMRGRIVGVIRGSANRYVARRRDNVERNAFPSRVGAHICREVVNCRRD